MKFDIYICMTIKIYHKIFCKDQCTHTRTRDVNVRARVSSRQNACARVYASCARLGARIFTKIHMINLNCLMNISIKFHKDRSFRCGDICKMILTFKNHRFSMYFAYFHSFSPSKSSKIDNY